MASFVTRLFMAVALFAAVMPSVMASKCPNVNHRTRWFYGKLGHCVFFNGPSPARNPPSNSGKTCPSNWAWSDNAVNGIANGCVPKQPWVTTQTPHCTGKNEGWSWSKWACVKTTVPPPQPTHHKRKNTPLPSKCAVGYTACPVATEDGLNNGFECLDTSAELESCGGCASIGEGQDCTAIPGAWNIACNRGKCEVSSCAPGWTMSHGRCVQA